MSALHPVRFAVHKQCLLILIKEKIIPHLCYNLSFTYSSVSIDFSHSRSAQSVIWFLWVSNEQRINSAFGARDFVPRLGIFSRNSLAIARKNNDALGQKISSYNTVVIVYSLLRTTKKAIQLKKMES